MRLRKIFLGGVLFFVFAVCGCKKEKTTGTAFDKKDNSNFPARIVALSPAATEILFAVGAGPQVVAVSDFTDYPPEAKNLPVVGGFDGKTLSMESIISYKPDLVYITNGMHNFMISQLEEYGIKYYVSVADSILGVENEILEIGEITGHKDKAAQVVEQMKKKLELCAITENPVLAYYEVWNSPYCSCGGKSFLSDVLKAAGYKNIFEDVEEAYPMVSEESIIAREPQVIFIAKSSGLLVEDVCSRSAWKAVPAVQHKKIFIIDDNVTTRPGPRVADVVEELGLLE